MQAAKKHGVIISYDLNYRESLWKGIGGKDPRARVTRSPIRLTHQVFTPRWGRGPTSTSTVVFSMLEHRASKHTGDGPSR